MAEKTEIDPNLFEHGLNVYIKKVGGKRNDSDEEDKLNMEVHCQVVNGDDFDVILALLFRKSGSSDWLQGGSHALKSMHFSMKFSDHQARFRMSNRTLANLPNVELTAFHIDVAQMKMDFKVNAKGIADGECVGKLTEALNRSVRVEISRAAHWSASTDQQKGLDLEATAQEHIDKNEKIQRAKDKANKANNNKVRELHPKTKAKTKPKAKAKSKAKAKTKPKDKDK